MLVPIFERCGAKRNCAGYLFISAQSGNLGLFNAIVLNDQDVMYRTADDATQESFISAYQHIKSFRGVSLEVWLLDATHNAENLGTQAFASDSVLTLPAQSATLFVIK